MRWKMLGALIVITLSLSPLMAFQQDPGDGGGIGGGGGPCTKSNCLTTCTGPTGVECCCWYQCPSGGTWVCKSGYCPETSRSCIW